MKFLGIFMDGKLDWYEHIRFCKQKNSFCPVCSKNCRQYLNADAAKILYYSLIYPYLSNWMHLWGSTYKTYLEQLIILQKKAVHIIANADFREHSLPLFRQPGILPLSKLHEYCLGKFIYRQHNNLALVQIMGDIVYNHNIHNYNTRGLSNIHVQYYRTQIVANSFLNKGQYQWQMIPFDIRGVHTFHSFSGWLKHFLETQIAFAT